MAKGKRPSERYLLCAELRLEWKKKKIMKKHHKCILLSRVDFSRSCKSHLVRGGFPFAGCDGIIFGKDFPTSRSLSYSVDPSSSPWANKPKHTDTSGVVCGEGGSKGQWSSSVLLFQNATHSQTSAKRKNHSWAKVLVPCFLSCIVFFVVPHLHKALEIFISPWSVFVLFR